MKERVKHCLSGPMYFFFSQVIASVSSHAEKIYLESLNPPVGMYILFSAEFTKKNQEEKRLQLSFVLFTDKNLIHF